MSKLTLVPANASAPRAATSYEVGPDLCVVIGRDTGCELHIEESQDMVSRRHVTVKVENDSLVAVDSSSNGLFVNSVRVAGMRIIEDEDILQLGPNGPMLAVALEPKPVKKPPPAKATRLYTPAVVPPVDTRPQALTNPEPIAHKVPLSGPTSPRDSHEAKPASFIRGSASAPSMQDASVYLDKVQTSALQAHGWLTQVFTHPVVFVLVYLFFMLLTYYLPYAGSNSAVAAAVHAAVSSVNKPFWAHLFSLCMMVGATWYRGSVIGKSWIMIFPIIAAVFDLAPLLNWIPLVPTAMHLAALIMGVRGRSS